MSLINYFMTGNLYRIKYSIISTNVNDTLDTINNTALHYAIKCKSIPIIKYLISIGADPYKKNLFNECSYTFAKLYQINDFLNIINEMTVTNSLKRKISDLEDKNTSLETKLDQFVKKQKTIENTLHTKINSLENEIEKKDKQINFFKRSNDSRKKN